MIKIIEQPFGGLLLLEPQLHEDKRGNFLESFNKIEFERLVGDKVNFVQDNQSLSFRGVLRGLHYQRPPMAQAKLVRVIQGEIFDVVVDLRQDSSSFGQWYGTYLSATNRRQLWIPEGFAHGFYTLTDTAECFYKVTSYYSQTHEQALLWSDPTIAIKWPLMGTPIMSEKDLAASPLNQLLNSTLTAKGSEL